MRRWLALIVFSIVVMLFNTGCALDTILNWMGSLGEHHALQT
jgi:hypothetical protein